MKIVSCSNCGVVLDQDQLQFDMYKEDWEIDTSKAVWNGDEWVAIVKCPVCQNDILEEP